MSLTPVPVDAASLFISEDERITLSMQYTTIETKPRAAVLWKALDVLRSRGMAKRVLEVTPSNINTALAPNQKMGSVCARGAIHHALSGSWQTVVGDWYDAEHTALIKTADELFPKQDFKFLPVSGPFNPTMAAFDYDPQSSSWCDIAAFNNHPDVTQDMLELVFEKTAIAADEIL